MNEGSAVPERHPWLRYFTIMGMLSGAMYGIFLGVLMFAGPTRWEPYNPLVPSLLVGLGIALVLGGIRALSLYHRWQEVSGLDEALAYLVILAGLPLGLMILVSLVLAIPVVLFLSFVEVPRQWLRWILWD